jgi:hypothetical protein
MMYLKFCGTSDKNPLREIVHETESYSVAPDDKGIRVYYRPGMWERLSETEWLNCFVIGESGKTIDKLTSPHIS